MADALAVIFSFPPDNVAKLSPKEYDKEITAYIKDIRNASKSLWTKPLEKQNILDLINPAVNSVPYLIALIQQINVAGKDKARNEDLLNRSLIFFPSFDPVQARYVGEEWSFLWLWMMDTLPKRGVVDFSPLSAALLRLDPTSGTFTTNHLRFIRLCLKHSVPSQALPILDKNIYAYPQAPVKNVLEDSFSEGKDLSNSFITTKSGFTSKVLPEHVLEYYLLGALVYIGLRNYTRARLFLECVILTPSSHHVCSALQVEAYKKWTMIGLLSNGKLFPLPRTYDQQIVKSIRAIAKSYDTLVDSFERRDWRKYQADMDTGTQIWVDDGNLRLVREAGDALLRYRVIDLRKTYASMPIGRVAAHVGFSADGTLSMVTHMIRQGYLNASITSSKAASAEAVLRFHTASPGPSTSSAQDSELEPQTKRIEALVTFVRDADRRLQLTKEYIEHQRRLKRSGAGPDGDLADQMDLTWDAPASNMASVEEDGDEDIMAT